MEKLAALPIDWATVDWPYAVALVLLVFVCTVIGTTLGFGRAFPSAVLSALLFATAFVFWTYYPHSLPLPASIKAEKASQPLPTPPASATAGDPVKPGNAITTISPPPASYQPR
jgi:hypothetical protein